MLYDQFLRRTHSGCLPNSLRVIWSFPTPTFGTVGAEGQPQIELTVQQMRPHERAMSDDHPHTRFNPLHAAPNLLTLMRICLAPFLVSAILEDRYGLGFGLFVAAGLTDALDGTLARWLRQRTVLGQYLDPVADKLLLSTIFVVLTHKNLIPTTVTVLVFGRDLAILVVAAILYAAVGRREFRPSLFGKANTVAQVTAVAVVLLHQIYTKSWVLGLRTMALDATVVLTVASGFHYAWMVTRKTGAPGGNGEGGTGK
jgi:cardiolipin synthase (CMP-forming)